MSSLSFGSFIDATSGFTDQPLHTTQPQGGQAQHGDQPRDDPLYSLGQDQREDVPRDGPDSRPDGNLPSDNQLPDDSSEVCHHNDECDCFDCRLNRINAQLPDDGSEVCYNDDECECTDCRLNRFNATFDPDWKPYSRVKLGPPPVWEPDVPWVEAPPAGSGLGPTLRQERGRFIMEQIRGDELQAVETARIWSSGLSEGDEVALQWEGIPSELWVYILSWCPTTHVLALKQAGFPQPVSEALQERWDEVSTLRVTLRASPVFPDLRNNMEFIPAHIADHFLVGLALPDYGPPGWKPWWMMSITKVAHLVGRGWREVRGSHDADVPTLGAMEAWAWLDPQGGPDSDPQKVLQMEVRIGYPSAEYTSYRIAGVDTWWNVPTRVAFHPTQYGWEDCFEIPYEVEASWVRDVTVDGDVELNPGPVKGRPRQPVRPGSTAPTPSAQPPASAAPAQSSAVAAPAPPAPTATPTKRDRRAGAKTRGPTPNPNPLPPSEWPTVDSGPAPARPQRVAAERREHFWVANCLKVIRKEVTSGHTVLVLQECNWLGEDDLQGPRLVKVAVPPALLSNVNVYSVCKLVYNPPCTEAGSKPSSRKELARLKDGREVALTRQGLGPCKVDQDGDHWVNAMWEIRPIGVWSEEVMMAAEKRRAERALAIEAAQKPPVKEAPGAPTGATPSAPGGREHAKDARPTPAAEVPRVPAKGTGAASLAPSGRKKAKDARPNGGAPPLLPIPPSPTLDLDLLFGDRLPKAETTSELPPRPRVSPSPTFGLELLFGGLREAPKTAAAVRRPRPQDLAPPPPAPSVHSNSTGTYGCLSEVDDDIADLFSGWGKLGRVGRRARKSPSPQASTTSGGTRRRGGGVSRGSSPTDPMDDGGEAGPSGRTEAPPTLNPDKAVPLMTEEACERAKVERAARDWPRMLINVETPVTDGAMEINDILWEVGLLADHRPDVWAQRLSHHLEAQARVHRTRVQAAMDELISLYFVTKKMLEALRLPAVQPLPASLGGNLQPIREKEGLLKRLGGWVGRPWTRPIGAGVHEPETPRREPLLRRRWKGKDPEVEMLNGLFTKEELSNLSPDVIAQLNADFLAEDESAEQQNYDLVDFDQKCAFLRANQPPPLAFSSAISIPLPDTPTTAAPSTWPPDSLDEPILDVRSSPLLGGSSSPDSPQGQTPLEHQELAGDVPGFDSGHADGPVESGKAPQRREVGAPGADFEAALLELLERTLNEMVPLPSGESSHPLAGRTFRMPPVKPVDEKGPEPKSHLVPDSAQWLQDIPVGHRRFDDKSGRNCAFGVLAVWADYVTRSRPTGRTLLDLGAWDRWVGYWTTTPFDLDHVVAALVDCTGHLPSTLLVRELGCTRAYALRSTNLPASAYLPGILEVWLPAAGPGHCSVILPYPYNAVAAFDHTAPEGSPGQNAADHSGKARQVFDDLRTLLTAGFWRPRPDDQFRLRLDSHSGTREWPYTVGGIAYVEDRAWGPSLPPGSSHHRTPFGISMRVRVLPGVGVIHRRACVTGALCASYASCHVFTYAPMCRCWESRARIAGTHPEGGGVRVVYRTGVPDEIQALISKHMTSPSRSVDGATIAISSEYLRQRNHAMAIDTLLLVQDEVRRHKTELELAALGEGMLMPVVVCELRSRRRQVGASPAPGRDLLGHGGRAPKNWNHHGDVPCPQCHRRQHEKSGCALHGRIWAPPFGKEEQDPVVVTYANDYLQGVVTIPYGTHEVPEFALPTVEGMKTGRPHPDLRVMNVVDAPGKSCKGAYAASVCVATHPPIVYTATLVSMLSALTSRAQNDMEPTHDPAVEAQFEEFVGELAKKLPKLHACPPIRSPAFRREMIEGCREQGWSRAKLEKLVKDFDELVERGHLTPKDLRMTGMIKLEKKAGFEELVDLGPSIAKAGPFAAGTNDDLGEIWTPSDLGCWPPELQNVALNWTSLFGSPISRLSSNRLIQFNATNVLSAMHLVPMRRLLKWLKSFFGDGNRFQYLGGLNAADAGQRQARWEAAPGLPFVVGIDYSKYDSHQRRAMYTSEVFLRRVVARGAFTDPLYRDVWASLVGRGSGYKLDVLGPGRHRYFQARCGVVRCSGDPYTTFANTLNNLMFCMFAFGAVFCDEAGIPRTAANVMRGVLLSGGAAVAVGDDTKMRVADGGHFRAVRKILGQLNMKVTCSSLQPVGKPHMVDFLGSRATPASWTDATGQVNGHILVPSLNRFVVSFGWKHGTDLPTDEWVAAVAQGWSDILADMPIYRHLLRVCRRLSPKPAASFTKAAVDRDWAHKPHKFITPGAHVKATRATWQAFADVYCQGDLDLFAKMERAVGEDMEAVKKLPVLYRSRVLEHFLGSERLLADFAG